MCENNGDVSSPVEEKQADHFGDEGPNEATNELVKFDIGDFVHHHRKIQILLGPWVRLMNSIMNVIW